MCRLPMVPLILLLLLVPPSLSAQERNLDDLLELDLSELLNLQVVSVLKSPETIDRSPATVRVITAEQIRDNGYFTLEDALADLPGLQFRNIQGFNSYVFMRGVPSQNNKILVLVDGVQINELNSGGFYGGGQYNLANVERIEVVYGPASALYGTNAVSGIINIVTRAPGGGAGGAAALGGGTGGIRLAQFRLADEASEGGPAFTLSGMLKASDKAELQGAEGDDNWTESLDNYEDDRELEGRLQWGDCTAGFVLQDKDASRATAQRTAGEPLSDHGVNWHTRFFNAWAAYDYDRPETWSLRTQFYYRDSTVLGDTVPVIELPQGDDPGRQYRYYRPNHLAGNETRLEWGPSPAWRFTFGLVLERERLADGYSITSSGSAGEEAPPPPRPPMTTNSLASAYAQARVALHPSLDLFAGIRHDDSSYYGTVDTPRLGLVLNRGRLTAKALAAEAFRAPRPWDYTDGTGNPELRPEEMRSYEVSGAWAFSGRWRLEAAAYRNRLDNLLVRVDGGAGWRWENGGGLDTDGVEAALEYRRGPWRGFVNATWTDSTGPADAPTPEIAEWGANGGVQVRFSTAFLLLVRAHYYGSRENPKPIPATGDARIDDAFVLGLAATLVLPGGFGLQLVVDNALDAEYYHPSNLDPSRYRQAQRTVRLVGGIAF